VLPSSVRACSFCDSSFSVGPAVWEEPQCSPEAAPSTHLSKEDAAWRGELSERLDAYRTRRRKLTPNSSQSQFTFEQPAHVSPVKAPIALQEPPQEEDDFSFTIAIGRPSKKLVQEESRMLIDVSEPGPALAGMEPNAEEEIARPRPGIHTVASMDDRRLAAVIDVFCLLFAYGGFLMLFGSLGGQFTLSKITAAVYISTFAIVYLQYFALFTVFGGTTPGMMMRGLQVVSLCGEPPTPRQMLLRSAGYMLSAGTFFLGFLWSLWDQDELTWHDRLSGTHLSEVQTFADLENSSVAQSR
jgi:uncharacterized RDD family membrane protein YckC